MSDERCPRCETPAAVRPVPERCRGLLEGDPATVAVCPACLTVEPAPGSEVDRDWTPGEVSDALPADADAAIALAMLVTLLSSIALHRREIEALVAFLEERPGEDALLALDRIASAPLLEPPIDVSRRRHQLAQMMGD